MTERTITRRKLLAAAGTASIIGLAGCQKDIPENSCEGDCHLVESYQMESVDAGFSDQDTIVTVIFKEPFTGNIQVRGHDPDNEPTLRIADERNVSDQSVVRFEFERYVPYDGWLEITVRADE